MRDEGNLGVVVEAHCAHWVLKPVQRAHAHQLVQRPHTHLCACACVCVLCGVVCVCVLLMF